MPNPSVLIGAPLFFKKGIAIYPPKVKEVVTNPNFNVFYKILTMTQDEIKDELKDKIEKGSAYPTPFEYLTLSCHYMQGFYPLVQAAFDFFCKAEVEVQNDIILIQTGESENFEMACITQEEYFSFQNLLREACGDKQLQPPEPEDPNEDPRIRAIKEKARYRDKVKAKHAAKSGISLGVCLTAICCMGIGITPLNIGEMSYASVGEIMKMMQDKEKYDIDIRSLLAGADSKKIKPKYWIRNTDKE